MSSDLFNGLDYDTQRELMDADAPFVPGAEDHDKIVKLVLEYAKIGFDTTGQNVDQFEKIDEIRDGFMPADELDRIRKGDDDRKPINIVTPLIYTHEQLFQTAMHRAFFSGEYYHRYIGSGSPERAARAALAEKVIAQQGMWFSERDASDIHWGDAYAHGQSYMWGKWSKKTAPRMVEDEVNDELAAALGAVGYQATPGETIRYFDEEEQINAEGTEWIPLDNYQVLRDPGALAGKVQESCFFGWVSDDDAMTLMKLEADPEEQLFNCAKLELLTKKGRATSTYWRPTDAYSKQMENQRDANTSFKNSRVHVVNMFCRLIPRDWGLSEARTPQIWFFGVGADKILIRATRVRTLHGGFPIVDCAPNRRGHQISPVSNAQIVYGNQIAVDYLIKQALDFQDLVRNGKFIFDQQYLDWNRFAQGGGPMGIPLKKRLAGKTIDDIYHQVKTENVTADNWSIVANINAFAKEGAGIMESLSDMPERTTAAGIDAIEGKGVSRMARFALIIDEQSRQQMARQNLCNTVQWMSMEVVTDLLGRNEQIIRDAYGLGLDTPMGAAASGLLVGGWDLRADFDVVPLSASSQNGRNLAGMTELMKTIMAEPMVLQEFVQRFRVEEFLFAYFREIGVSDADWYRRVNLTPGVPNGVVQGQVQQGNLVSMQQAQQEVGAAA